MSIALILKIIGMCLIVVSLFLIYLKNVNLGEEIGHPMLFVGGVLLVTTGLLEYYKILE